MLVEEGVHLQEIIMMLRKKWENWLIGSALALGCGVLGVAPYASGGEEPTAGRGRQVKETAIDPGVRASPEELMDMIYANDLFRPPGPNEDGSIPLTFEKYMELTLSHISANEEALSTSESVNAQVDDVVVSRTLSREQVTELSIFGKTSVSMGGKTFVSVGLPLSLRLAFAAVNAGGVEDASFDEERTAQEPVELGESAIASAGSVSQGVVARGCAYVINCDANDENCVLVCSGTCSGALSCAEVIRRKPGGGSQRTCECVPDQE